MVRFAYQLKDEINKDPEFTVNIKDPLIIQDGKKFSMLYRVHSLFPEEVEKKIWPLPIFDLFLLARRLQKLYRQGIFTIGESALADEWIIRSHLKRYGQIVQGYARL